MPSRRIVEGLCFALQPHPPFSPYRSAAVGWHEASPDDETTGSIGVWFFGCGVGLARMRQVERNGEEC